MTITEPPPPHAGLDEVAGDPGLDELGDETLDMVQPVGPDHGVRLAGPVVSGLPALSVEGQVGRAGRVVEGVADRWVLVDEVA